MKGIILHGGHGTRLRPLTHTGPKQLLPIANKPMSEYCMESIRETGITDIAIIIGGLGSNKVKEYYGTGEQFGIKITYVEQDEPKGIAHAISLCEDFIDDEKFVVFLGDNIINTSISNFIQSENFNLYKHFLHGHTLFLSCVLFSVATFFPQILLLPPYFQRFKHLYCPHWGQYKCLFYKGFRNSPSLFGTRSDTRSRGT